MNGWKKVAIILTDDQRKLSIHEVERYTGVPRTRIRHYVDKGLLDPQKDERSGYYYYCRENLVRLCQIVYYRETLGFSIEAVSKILKNSNIELIEDINERQQSFLSEEKRLREKQLLMLSFNKKLIENQYRFRDRLTVIPFDTAYVFPFSNYLQPGHELYPILYGASEFSFDGETVSPVQKCCLVFERDREYVDSSAFDRLSTEQNRVEARMCVYTVILTSKNIHDHSLLLPVIKWATTHRFRISGRIFITYFFPFYRESLTYHYVEVYLPIDIF